MDNNDKNRNQGMDKDRQPNQRTGGSQSGGSTSTINKPEQQTGDRSNANVGTGGGSQSGRNFGSKQ